MSGEYPCCIHCEHTEGEFDPHTLDPPPHPKPCAEGCNDADE
ncbi:MAG TPA: hypothetical protein VHZ03_41305 [Trebonia sp.]|jgi:hypothetical protein|nr:hypothetical protein [Trebonia sp.]